MNIVYRNNNAPGVFLASRPVKQVWGSPVEFSCRVWESRAEGKVNKALDSQMQKESAMQNRVTEVFMHTGVGISG